MVVDPRLGRPVVGVRVVQPGPLGGTGPRRPGVEGGEVVDLLLIGDGARDQALGGGGVTEEVPVVPLQLLEGADLLVGEHQGAGGLVVPVGALHLGGGGGWFLHALRFELLMDVLGAQPQVLGGVVRAQVRTVPDDRAVLLDAPCQEDVLAAGDLLLGVDHLAVLADHLLRQGHGIGVGAVGEDAHHEEPEHQHECDALHPALGDGNFRTGALLITFLYHTHASDPFCRGCDSEGFRSTASRRVLRFPSERQAIIAAGQTPFLGALTGVDTLL